MSICRRDVLFTLCSAAAAGVLGEPALAARKRRNRKLPAFGVILGSLNTALGEDAAGTLKHLARLGYKELEFGGAPKGTTDADFKQMISDNGLRAVAGGAAMHQLNTQFPKLVESAHTYGRKYLVCYWPWADNGKDKRLDDWKRLGAHLNGLGEKAKAEGLTLAYHNHDIEFAATDGQLPFDVILANTDPALVAMELDIYWIYKGGQDAAATIRRYPGRFSLFHVKDMDATPARERVCVGEGTLPFADVFAALAEQTHEQHFFWEREGRFDAKTELACATQSAKHLQRLRY